MRRPSSLRLIAAAVIPLVGCSDPTTEPVSEPVSSHAASASVVTTAAGTWTVRAAMPQPRTWLAAVTLDAGAGPRFYALGGITPNGGISTSVNAYNPTTNAWSSAAPLPTRVYRTNGAGVIGGKIYLAGGLTIRRVVEASLRVYNPATNTWSSGALMPNPGFDGVTAVIGNQLYVLTSCSAGGDCDVSFDRALYRYTPATNSWVQLASPPHPHREAVAGVIAGKLYVAGDNGTGSRALDVYNPGTNTWTTRANLPKPRWAAAGDAINGKLYVVGGIAILSSGSSGVPVATTSVYDPATNSWTHVTPLPSARFGNAAARLGSAASARLELVGAGPGNNHLEFQP